METCHLSNMAVMKRFTKIARYLLSSVLFRFHDLLISPRHSFAILMTGLARQVLFIDVTQEITVGLKHT